MSSSIESLISREYEAGFVTDIESDTLPPGLNEGTVRAISAKKNEPAFMLEWRLKAYRRWRLEGNAAPPGGVQQIKGLAGHRAAWLASAR